MQTVGIIYGGKSSEHEVSLVSATSVVRNINREKFNIILIGISKKGKWFVQQEDELNRILTDSNSTLKSRSTQVILRLTSANLSNISK